MMKQILLNLLSNAVKFTPHEGRITLSIAVDSRSDVIMSVEDNGIGIKQEDLRRIMQPFTQVEATDTKKYEGTGLGLPLVKAMVGVLGGVFALVSEFGVGTTASVTWPHGIVCSEALDKVSNSN